MKARPDEYRSDGVRSENEYIHLLLLPTTHKPYSYGDSTGFTPVSLLICYKINFVCEPMRASNIETKRSLLQKDLSTGVQNAEERKRGAR